MGGDVRLPSLTAEGNAMLKVEEIEGRGRGLVVRTALKAGTVVAVCDPLVAVPSMEWRHHSCGWCFTTDDHKRLPRKCDGGCSVTRYCSDCCARADRSSVHTPNVCSALRRLTGAASSPPCPTTLLVTSILASAYASPSEGEGAREREGEGDGDGEGRGEGEGAATGDVQEEGAVNVGITQEDVWAGLWRLCWLRHAELEEDLRNEMATIAARVTACLNASSRSLPLPPAPPTRVAPPLATPSSAGSSGARVWVWQGLAWEVLLRLECNVFSYWGEGYGEQRGMGVFVHAAMFNHSCRPNTAKVLRGRLLVFVLLQDVGAGDEVCISYLPSDMPRRERQTVLQRHFRFECSCVRCREGEGGGVEATAHVDCGGFWVPQQEEAGTSSAYCSLCGAIKRG